MNTAANLTTTVGGGLSLVNFLATSKKPSERVAIGEAHLNSAISVLAEMLDKRADHVSRPEIRELRRQHDDLSSRAGRLRKTIRSPWSLDIQTLKAKISMYNDSRKFEDEARELNADAQRSSRQAASEGIKQQIGETDTVDGPEELSRYVIEDYDEAMSDYSSFETTGPEAGSFNLAQPDALTSGGSEQDIALLPLSGPSKWLSVKGSNATLRASCQNNENPFVDDSNNGIN